MILFKQHYFTYNLIIAISFCTVTFLQAQDTINVLVKVYDLELIPISNLEITIQDAGLIQTNTDGISADFNTAKPACSTCLRETFPILLSSLRISWAKSTLASIVAV